MPLFGRLQENDGGGEKRASSPRIIYIFLQGRMHRTRTIQIRFRQLDIRNILYTLDEGVVGSGMGIFMIGSHLPKFCRKTKKGPAKGVYCVHCTLSPRG
jgi:hypothetical protein